jgi:hypothetical protein
VTVQIKKGVSMNIFKQLCIGLVFVLSACTATPIKSPVKATTAPEATSTVLPTSPKVPPTPTTREQPVEPDENTFGIEDHWQPSEPPERVEFASGANSAQFSSLLPSGLSIKQFVLAAKEGQIMTVNFVSEDVPVSLSITSPSGKLLFSEILQADGSSSGGNVHTLVESGEYLITLTKADHSPSTRYTVNFTIQ